MHYSKCMEDLSMFSDGEKETLWGLYILLDSELQKLQRSHLLEFEIFLISRWDLKLRWGCGCHDEDIAEC